MFQEDYVYTDPDQDQHSVGLDLGPNCLQRSAVDDKIHCWHAKS